MAFKDTLFLAGSTARSIGQLGLAVLPVVPTRHPVAANKVSAEWLTTTFSRQHPGAAALSVTPLDGTTGTTDRRRLRVEWNEAGRAAGLPEVLYIKSTSLTAKNRTMVGALDMARNEVRFYNQVADQVSDHVPRAWFAYSGLGARHLLVLEDLSSSGSRPYPAPERDELTHARELMETLATVHATFWQSPRLQGDLKWVRKWSQRPGYAVLKAYYRRGWRSVLKDQFGDATPADRALAEALERDSATFYAQFERGPLTLLHGDPHLGNTFFFADGRTGLLDWQVIWQGPGLREVAYALAGGLTPEVRRAHDRELIDHYLSALEHHGVAEVPSSDEAFEHFRVFAVERWLASAFTRTWAGLQTQERMESGWKNVSLAANDYDLASAVTAL